jgi:hypothetical protein
MACKSPFTAHLSINAQPTNWSLFPARVRHREDRERARKRRKGKKKKERAGINILSFTSTLA